MDPRFAPTPGAIVNAAMKNTPRVDPEKLTLPALAQGYIGRVPWAIVERGDGLVLAIGEMNVPIDTPGEWTGAFGLGYSLVAQTRKGGS